MILLNGVSGFNGPNPKTDGEYFKKICYSVIQSIDGNVISFCEPGVTRHYYIVKVEVSDLKLYILLNLIYPFVTFASSVDPSNIRFIQHEKLTAEFSPFYRVLSPTELNEPLVIRNSKGRTIVENKNELNEAELGLIKYFNSKTVGDIVFNYWD
jgi:hypothetical protein